VFKDARNEKEKEKEKKGILALTATKQEILLYIIW
jgi:hypothetical protein